MKKSEPNKLLFNANKCLIETGYSLETYDAIIKIFSVVKPNVKNNAKAILKKDLSQSSSMAVIVSIFGVLAGVFVRTITPIYIAGIFIPLMTICFALLYGLYFLPSIRKSTYVLSIIEDKIMFWMLLHVI